MRIVLLPAAVCMLALSACRESKPPEPPVPVEKPEPVETPVAVVEPKPIAEPPPPPPPAKVEPLPSRGCTPLWLAAESKGRPAQVAKKLGLKRWNLCDPTHEKFLLAVLREARRVPVDATFDDPKVAEYVRGMLWNDDPEGLLFERDGSPARNGAWLTSYRTARARAERGKPMTASAPLHARTLFGDLQFVHALTGDPAQPVVESLDDIYRWLEFTWRVAVGDIGANVKLSEVDLEGFAALFPAQADWTVGKFFAAEGSPDVSERALGAFLHTVQDSYAQTHLQRATDDLGRAYVRNIGTVAKGNHSGHANDPGWRDGWTEGVILWEVAPAMTGAFQRAVDLTRLAGYRRGWPAARAYLEMHVLPTFAPKDDRR